MQPEDGHYQEPKHVVLYVGNTLYSANKYSCVRRVHTLYISHPFCILFCQGGYIVSAEMGATCGADGSNDNCNISAEKRWLWVQLSAAVMWLVWCLWRVMANILC